MALHRALSMYTLFGSQRAEPRELTLVNSTAPVTFRLQEARDEAKMFLH